MKVSPGPSAQSWHFALLRDGLGEIDFAVERKQ